MELSHKYPIFEVSDPPTPACHASTIVDAGDRLLCAWFGGTREGHPDVGIWLSAYVRGNYIACRPLSHSVSALPTWSTPRLVTGDDEQEPCWNPVLVHDSNLTSLFYKSGPSPREWHGRLIESADGGETWTDPKILRAPSLGPIKNKSVRVGDDWLHPSSTEHDGWKCHFEIGGRCFSVPDPLVLGGIQPTILRTPKGFVALARTQSGAIGRTESTDGRAWSPLLRSGLFHPGSGIDAVTLRDGRHLLVYNPNLRRRSPLSVAVSADTWQWERVADLEVERGEFSYPAVIQASDGLVHVTYTHRRRTICHAIIEI